MNWQVLPYELHFKRAAKTSRDTLISKQIWFLHLMENDLLAGIGEVAPIFGLSVETKEEVIDELNRIQRSFDTQSALSSVKFAMEMALAAREVGMPYEPFLSQTHLRPIAINGLVWMNEIPEMRREAKQKIAEGNSCIKLKIGALNFEDELALIAELRDEFPKEKLTIRVDANGAFKVDEAVHVLERLSKYTIHSIEQPIRAGQTKALFELATVSPVPIALDEELIGETPAHLNSFLKFGKPHYLVIKPSIHGGFEGATHWINWAKENEIGYWITSALESNIGLNAIARWVCAQDIGGVQGLGTGSLFLNNMNPLWEVQGSKLIPINRV